MTQDEDCSVLIVGAGPVGMTVAIELGRRGHPCVLIERGNGHNDHPRANVVSPRTMEHFRRWGIAGEVQHAGLPLDSKMDVIFTTRLLSHEITRFKFPSTVQIQNPDLQLIRDYPDVIHSPYYKTAVGQNFLEPVLRAHVESLSAVQLRLNTDLVDMRQEATGVVVTLRDQAGQTRTIRSRFVVACDGARSTVRDILNVAMSGRSFLGSNLGIYFRSPDLLTRMQKGTGILYWTFAPSSHGSFIAIDGRQHWVMQRRFQQGEDSDTIDARRCVAEGMGGDVPFDILSVRPWVARQLVADNYRVGNVFLAGDSAHLVSPTGGFGMNTGIGDGVDIGWKLSAVLEGWAPEALLDTYGEERKPIAHRNAVEATDNRTTIDASSRLNAAIEETSEIGANLRRDLANRISQQRKHFAAIGIHLGYRYEGSRLIVPDGTEATPDKSDQYIPTARPGSRAPHIWLGRNRSILDTFGHGFTLLRFGNSPINLVEKVAQQSGIPLSTVAIDSVAAKSLYACDMALIRPDGHVAWRGGDDASAANAILVASGRSVESSSSVSLSRTA